TCNPFLSLGFLLMRLRRASGWDSIFPQLRVWRVCRSTVESSLLSPQDRQSGGLPPTRINTPEISSETLQNNHRRKKVEVRLIDSAVRDAIARDSSHDQHIERWKEEIVGTDVGEPHKGGLHELATAHKNQAAMVLGSLPKIDRQPHAPTEDDHVHPED